MDHGICSDCWPQKGWRNEAEHNMCGVLHNFKLEIKSKMSGGILGFNYDIFRL